MKRSSLIGFVLVALLAGLWAAFGRPQTPDSVLAREIAAQVARAEAMGMRNTATGRVLYPDGRPVANALVIARFRMPQSGAPGEGSALTDTDGRFQIRGLGQNQFMIGPSRMPDYIVPSPIEADITKRSSIDLGDFRLTLGPEVTVTVRDAETNKPVAGLRVNTGDIGMPLRRLTTDAKGMASFRSDTLTFELSVEDPSSPPAYGPAPGYPLYRQVQLKKPEPVNWDLLVYSTKSESKPATFRGVVVDPSGTPVEGAKVVVHRYNDHLAVTTDSQGAFAVQMRRIDPYEDPQRGAAVTAEKDGLRAFQLVSAKETWNGVRLVLGTEKPGIAHGRVVDEHGKPLPACRFTYWETFGIAIGSVGPSGTFYTNPDGSFRLTDLHQGAFYTFGFGSLYAGNNRVGTLNIPPLGKAPIFLTEQGIDLGTIVLPHADRVITGKISTVNGPLQPKNLLITLKGAHTDLSTSPEPTGQFRFEGVVDEPLQLSVFSGNNGFRTGKDSPDRLIDRDVHRGENNVVLKVRMRAAQP